MVTNGQIYNPFGPLTTKGVVAKVIRRGGGFEQLQILIQFLASGHLTWPSNALDFRKGLTKGNMKYFAACEGLEELLIALG